MNKRRAAFSLLELLMAMSVLSLLVVMLCTIIGQASRVFSRSQAQTDALGNFRAATTMLSRDLKSALLPVDRTNQASLQFILNPPALSADYRNRDALFWQTARESQTNSTGVSIVGYFVSWDTTQPDRPKPQLCRMAITSSDPNYLIYSQPNQWITDDVIKATASATKANNYRGLLAGNVVGLWITLETKSGGALTAVTNFDSRATGSLPAAALVSLAFISPSAAARLTPSDAAEIQKQCKTKDATNFIAGLPAQLKPEAQIYTTRISLP